MALHSPKDRAGQPSRASPSSSPGFLPGRPRRGRGREGAPLGSWPAFLSLSAAPSPGRRKHRSPGHWPPPWSASAHPPPITAPAGATDPGLPGGTSEPGSEEDGRHSLRLVVTKGPRLDEAARLRSTWRGLPLSLGSATPTSRGTVLGYVFMLYSPAWKPTSKSMPCPAAGSLLSNPS